MPRPVRKSYRSRTLKANWRINPYQKYSKTVKLLRLALREVGFQGLVNINWGLGKNSLYSRRELNPVSVVQDVVSKLHVLKVLDEHNIPTLNWTTNMEQAKNYATKEKPIYCRETLRTHGGIGIVVATTPDEVVPATLYTQAFTPNREYRIHVMKNNIILAQRKKKKYGEGSDEEAIKNHDNGYYFSLCDVERLHPGLLTTAKDTLEALGLDFGAVDILRWDDENQVLEVNTAPGLSPANAMRYANAFKQYYA